MVNVLIVDDNRDLADGLGLVLEDEGYQVVTAYNGSEGIEAFIAGQFDVVIIDVKLTDVNGIEVFQKIYKNDPKARALLMTGYRIEQLLGEVVEDGQVKILRDPIKCKPVLEIVNQIANASIILIEKDDPDFAGRLSVYLNDHGLNANLANSGQDAVDLVSSNQIDVIVMNLQMPIIYSLEVYLEIKQRGSALKTIIVTGVVNEEPNTVDSLRSVSVTGCLFKPFSTEYMLHAIDWIRDR